MTDAQRTAIIAVTRRGAALAARLADAPGRRCAAAREVRPDAGAAGRSACYSGSVLEEIRRCWGRYRALVLIMASGVAVRAIAPLLGEKSSDPAVICLDEAGRWAIPLLGGHQAGANQLAQRIAALTGGQASITTASDGQGKPALDLLGRALGWRIDEASALTHASACLVNDEPIGVWVNPQLPAYAVVAELLAQADNATLVDSLDALHGDAYAAGLIVSHWGLEPKHAALIEKSVVYRPPVLVVGMGCRRGVPLDELRAALDATFADAGPGAREHRGARHRRSQSRRARAARAGRGAGRAAADRPHAMCWRRSTRRSSAPAPRRPSLAWRAWPSPARCWCLAAC